MLRNSAISQYIDIRMCVGTTDMGLLSSDTCDKAQVVYNGEIGPWKTPYLAAHPCQELNEIMHGWYMDFVDTTSTDQESCTV